MRLIDAETKIKMLLFDEMYEEQITREMTVEEALDLYTEDGCPTTVDAEPVRHGHWIMLHKTHNVDEDNDYDWKCSECNHVDCHNINVEVHGKWNIVEGMPTQCSLCGYYVKQKTYKYCPNCGARMENDDNM